MIRQPYVESVLRIGLATNLAMTHGLNPGTLSNCVLYLPWRPASILQAGNIPVTADAQTVAKWTDASFGGNDFLQAKAGNRPRYFASLGLSNFDGTAYMTGSTSVNLSGDFSLWCLMYATENGEATILGNTATKDYLVYDPIILGCTQILDSAGNLATSAAPPRFGRCLLRVRRAGSSIFFASSGSPEAAAVVNDVGSNGLDFNTILGRAAGGSVDTYSDVNHSHQSVCIVDESLEALTPTQRAGIETYIAGQVL